ncbi:hypothetical protein AMTR_s00025p00037060 [Amborella trichopoda]|uniref:Uncharacterized protein n=2 Tax=Amborella trichopoda TaxID=13333 RepID=W1PXW4_AMBTC|nr:hypothetical protein AMTR_s00025p00037060 [Amborella trichopoda]
MEDGSSSRVVEASSSSPSSSSILLHLIKETLGFTLYMHHQIPSILQHLELEFTALTSECISLEELIAKQKESRASSQRKNLGRLREVKHGIKQLEKLMNSVSSVISAVEMMVNEIPQVGGFLLVLGGSLVRPLHVYEVSFSHDGEFSQCPKDCTSLTNNGSAEALSRKVIRALISKDAGGDSFSGPAKLFVLIKAPCTFNLPLHFLPKREFRYSRKIQPFRLHIKFQTDNSKGFPETVDCSSNDMIW